MPNLILKATDGKTFVVDVKVAKKAEIFKEMLDFFGEDGDEAENLLPISHINGETLKNVLRWCEHHVDDLDNDDAGAVSATPNSDNIPEWDVEFLKALDENAIFDIMVAANYLNIKALMDSTAKTIANMIKCRTIEEIRELFNIENDYTEEEEDIIRLQNKWCERG